MTFEFFVPIVIAYWGTFLVHPMDCGGPPTIGIDEVNYDNTSVIRMKLLTSTDVMTSSLFAFYLTALKEQCTEVNVRRTLIDFETCLVPLDSIVYDINKNISDTKSREDVEMGFKTYCKNWELMKGCLETLTSALSPCLNGTLIDTINNIKKAIYASLTYACTDDRWPNLITKIEMQCHDDPISHIYGCLGRNILYQFFYIFDVWWNPLNIRFDKPFCKFFYKVHKCALFTYKYCDDQDHAYSIFTRSVYEAIRDATPCVKYDF